MLTEAAISIEGLPGVEEFTSEVTRLLTGVSSSWAVGLRTSVFHHMGHPTGLSECP